MGFLQDVKQGIALAAINAAGAITKWSTGSSLDAWISGGDHESFVGGKDYRPPKPTFENIIRYAFRKNPVAYACIDLISKAISALPWRVIKPDSKGNVEKIDNIKYPLYKLFDRPQRQYSWTAHLKLLTTILMSSGESYTLKRSGEANEPIQGIPRALFVFPPTVMEPEESKIWGIIGGFKYTPPNTGKIESFAADDVLQIRLNTDPLDPLHGIAPLEAAFRDVCIFNEGDLWLERLLKNSSRPGTAWIADSELSDNARYAAEKFIDRLYAGAMNAGKDVLSGNLTPHPLGWGPMDMGIIDISNVTVVRICTAMGVPPLLVGILDKSNYNNIKQATLNFYRDTILPLAYLILDEYNRYLTPSLRDGTMLDIDLGDIEQIQEDRNERAKRHDTYLKYGVYSPNYVARELGVDDKELTPAGNRRYIDASRITMESADGDYSMFAPNPKDEPKANNDE